MLLDSIACYSSMSHYTSDAVARDICERPQEMPAVLEKLNGSFYFYPLKQRICHVCEKIQTRPQLLFPSSEKCFNYFWKNHGMSEMNR
jgi:hypothetical protein